ncbi:MAG: hypothetical protein FJZ63_06485, partial [Chlamydiae bacterium]|nr:hypothetical protein [Chlamydiota bacterium]
MSFNKIRKKFTFPLVYPFFLANYLSPMLEMAYSNLNPRDLIMKVGPSSPHPHIYNISGNSKPRLSSKAIKRLS